MHWLSLSLKNILHRPLYSLVGILLLAFGVSVMGLLLQVESQMEEKIDKQTVGIDMVVGAKGSPLQLILANIFHIDNPTGNISYSEYQKLVSNPLVKDHYPLSYGDNYRGFKILGTTKKFISLYNGELESGRLWENSMEVIVGSEVYINTGLTEGKTFESSHGMDEEGEKHSHDLFRVVGILKPTGTILDRLIITDLHSIWDIHHHEENEEEHHHDENDHDDHSHHHDHEMEEITAGLIRFNSPLGSVTLPRQVNEKTNMQAALPNIEIERMMSIVGIGVETISTLGYVLIVLAFISIFIAMIQFSSVIKYELALLRAMGTSAFSIGFLVILQALWICMFGYIFGWAISRLLFFKIFVNTSQTWIGYFSLELFKIQDLWLFGIVMAIGIFASIIPAIQVFKRSVTTILSEGK